ncbi:hypothetical protein GA707_11330 [Nostocoides sp. F2B08]|uniref:hypothetical protein n=1 Tax=Nostocoides sp. F2B08 TaxID=2653936 RepID=UPI00126315B5|nr:hypothetical protein [Tetrasphaera sp. F2B08]KAB7744046.1 hypothetical protein GA707_11330 [Tetrasphaera sp. F2B08]
MISLEEGLAAARTGDLWIFRGRTVVNKVMHAATNSPVNHVGMTVALDDLPPLLWHAEIGRSMYDYWAGRHHRGTQLHDLKEAVQRWQDRYGQRAYLRQLTPEVGLPEEDRMMLAIARLDGTSFPSYVRLAARWLAGRDAHASRRRRERVRPQDAFCAEVVGTTLTEMGILSADVPPEWYDPGRFWSGDSLPLRPGWSYGAEVEVAREGASLTDA